jgi:hypothetical protein
MIAPGREPASAAADTSITAAIATARLLLLLLHVHKTRRHPVTRMTRSTSPAKTSRHAPIHFFRNKLPNWLFHNPSYSQYHSKQIAFQPSGNSPMSLQYSRWTTPATLLTTVRFPSPANAAS